MGILEDISEKLDHVIELIGDDKPVKKRAAKKRAAKKAANKEPEETEQAFMQTKEYDTALRTLLATNPAARDKLRQAVDEIAGPGTKVTDVDPGDRQAVLDRANALLEETDDLEGL